MISQHRLQQVYLVLLIFSLLTNPAELLVAGQSATPQVRTFLPETSVRDAPGDTQRYLLDEYGPDYGASTGERYSRSSIDIRKISYQYKATAMEFITTVEFSDKPNITAYHSFFTYISFEVRRDVELNFLFSKHGLPDEMRSESSVQYVDYSQGHTFVDVQVFPFLVNFSDKEAIIMMDLSAYIGTYIRLDDLFIQPLQKYSQPQNANTPYFSVTIEEHFGITQYGWSNMYSDDLQMNSHIGLSLRRALVVYWPFLLALPILLVIITKRKRIKGWIVSHFRNK